MTEKPIVSDSTIESVRKLVDSREPAEALPSQTSGAESLVADLQALSSNYWSIKTADKSNPVFWYDHQVRLIEKVAAYLAALAKPASEPAGGGVREAAETRGPYEARICKDIPTDCCDYGVVSLSEGREVCRVWREQDARAIAAALSSPASSSPAEASGEKP